MSILQKNLIKNKKNITKNIFGEREPNIFFHENIKSVNLPKYYFTNYIDDKKSPLIKLLKRERGKFIRKQVNFDKEYELKSIDTNKEQLKVDEILKNTIGINSIPVKTIFRLKSIDNPSVQFFFLDDYQGNYKVLFIDLYHLVLPARDLSRKEKKANPKKTYENHKMANYCLSNIFNSKL